MGEFSSHVPDNGEGGGGEGGGGGGAVHCSIWSALPPKRKLRPLPMQQAALYVTCAQYSWQVRPLSGCEGACGLRLRCGLRGLACGAPHAPRTPIGPHRRTRPSFSSETHSGPVGPPGCPLRPLAPTSRTCLRTQGAGACWTRAVWKGRRGVRRRGLRGWRAPVLTPPALLTGTVSVTVESAESA